MSFSLGLDTGGTYTDAVIFDDAKGKVIAKAKALTTRHDLSVGIAQAVERVIERADINTVDVGLVSISTTLATNALVEGQGRRVALVMLGFAEPDLDRSGLREALYGDPVVFLPGGHNVHGKPSVLDISALEERLAELVDGVSAFAIAGQFSVRNPEHEVAVRTFLRDKTNMPVTCSHELSAQLDGPRRALTCLLNARLVELIGRLIEATGKMLDKFGIEAPLMVVRGDGSLVSADFATARPIETILSGPASSLIGARFLTGEDHALVADIGGTTTDVAILEEGRPKTDINGATVGGFRTMVEAVAMRTYGLGGDSEVRLEEGALDAQILLGPRRAVPLSMLGHLFGYTVTQTLESQLRSEVGDRLDGRFVLATGIPQQVKTGLSRSEAALLSQLTTAPVAMRDILSGSANLATLNRLVALGLAQISAFTVSDAHHVIGSYDHWNTEAARLGAELFCRKKDGRGLSVGRTAEELSKKVVERLERLSAERLLETAFFGDGLDGEAITRSPLISRALDRGGKIVRTALVIDRPLIGLGAGARTVYPNCATVIGMQSIIPDDADVANAIGAVVGQVRITAQLEVHQRSSGAFIINGPTLPIDAQLEFSDETKAIETALNYVRQIASEQAVAAGATEPQIKTSRQINAVDVEGGRQFIDATLTAVATGRPAS